MIEADGFFDPASLYSITIPSVIIPDFEDYLNIRTLTYRKRGAEKGVKFLVEQKASQNTSLSK